jgi:hypothetical protein
MLRMARQRRELLATYVALTAVLSIAAGALDADIKRFAMAFSAVF